MDVEGRRDSPSESGQSILEFLMMLPVLIGLVVMLIRVNTAIQISINNQKFARAQALLLTYNSAIYPEIKLRVPNLDEKSYNHMLLGVSNKLVSQQEKNPPESPRHKISKAKGGANDCSGEGDGGGGKRATVCVRNTVTLCTQQNVSNTSGGSKPIFVEGGVYNIPSPGGYCTGPRKHLDVADGEDQT